MKNRIWIAVSFSMLTGIALANTADNKESVDVSDRDGNPIEVSRDASDQVRSLELNSKPEFQKASFCVADVKQD